MGNRQSEYPLSTDLANKHYICECTQKPRYVHPVHATTILLRLCVYKNEKKTWSTHQKTGSVFTTKAKPVSHSTLFQSSSPTGTHLQQHVLITENHRISSPEDEIKTTIISFMFLWTQIIYWFPFFRRSVYKISH